MLRMLMVGVISFNFVNVTSNAFFCSHHSFAVCCCFYQIIYYQIISIPKAKPKKIQSRQLKDEMYTCKPYSFY